MRFPSGGRRGQQQPEPHGEPPDGTGFSIAGLREHESREFERRGAGTPASGRDADPGAQGPPYDGPTAPPYAAPRPAPAPAPSPAQPSVPVSAWQPIVVDRATVEFEPRPPGVPVRRHIPDTVFDGWSSDSFTVRSASVRGYAHRYNGAPREDHMTVFFQRRGRREEVLFAVADGVSNARHGELGAVAASEAAVEALQEILVSGERLEWAEVFAAAVRHMTAVARRHLKIDEPSTLEIGTLLATTLTIGAVGALADRHRVLMARVGDSGAWVLDGTGFTPVFPGKQRSDSGVVSSAVTALPHIPDPVTATAFDLLPHQVLLVGTDGFGDPLGDGTGPVGQLFAEHLATPPPPRGLAHLLDFSRETFDDDRTLLALWPLRRTREGS